MFVHAYRNAGQDLIRC